MIPRLHRPRPASHLPDAPGRLRRASPLVLGIIGLSLLSGFAQVAGTAASGTRPAVHAAFAASQPGERDDEALGAAAVAVDFVELPTASVEAINL